MTDFKMLPTGLWAKLPLLELEFSLLTLRGVKGEQRQRGFSAAEKRRQRTGTAETQGDSEQLHRGVSLCPSSAAPGQRQQLCPRLKTKQRCLQKQNAIFVKWFFWIKSPFSGRCGELAALWLDVLATSITGFNKHNALPPIFSHTLAPTFACICTQFYLFFIPYNPL